MSFPYLRQTYHLPFLCRGLRVQVAGRWETVRSGQGCYVRVVFDDDVGRVRTEKRWYARKTPCHPTWEVVYYAKDGAALADFRTKEGGAE